jgi:predicted nucleic acid-binding protein
MDELSSPTSSRNNVPPSASAETGLEWAELLARLRASGRAMPIKGSLIAATALVHGLCIATRNRSDFVNRGVKIVDPFLEG